MESRVVKIGKYETHPAADVLPMMDPERYAELEADIEANGQRVPIDMWKGKILDGRNRMKACVALGRQPMTFVFTGTEAEAVTLVASKNLKRRDLSKGQRAAVILELETLGHGGSRSRSGSCSADPPASRADLARGSGVSKSTVAQLKSVRERGVPQLYEAVKAGNLAPDAASVIAARPKTEQRELVRELGLHEGKQPKLGHARALVRQHEKRAIAAKLETNRMPMPLGPYHVIVSDPPWLFDNSDSHAGSRGHTPYPTMPEADICALGDDVRRMANDDCILWLWVPNALIVDGTGSRVIKAWDWTPITTMTWKKNKLGMGSWLRNQTEHAILAVRGKPTMLGSSTPNWFEGEVREHSRKPDRFYEIVEATCPGSKIEMFAREAREGWARWGVEANKFNADAA